MGEMYFVGLIIVSMAMGCLTQAAVGWLIFGCGLICAAMLQYLNGGRG